MQRQRHMRRSWGEAADSVRGALATERQSNMLIHQFKGTKLVTLLCLHKIARCLVHLHTQQYLAITRFCAAAEKDMLL